MHYESYTASDFAADEYFVRWVKQPDYGSDKFWSGWLLEHPENKETVEEARYLIEQVQFAWEPDTEDRADALWQRISATNRAAQATEKPAVVTRGENRPSWSKIAASVALLVLLSALFLLNYRHRDTIETSQNKSLAEIDRQINYQTGAGELKQIILPDRSEVVLNANSTLSIPPQWGAERKVWLSGEAYFSVKKLASVTDGQKTMAKFTVVTPSLRVQVIGTAFNVSERNQKAVVVLNSGSIQLKLPSDSTILMEPGELIAYEPAEQRLEKKEVKPETYSAWKNSEWILDNQNLTQVAARIEETFNVEVEIRNQEHSRGGISGVVPTENLDILLEALATTLKVKVIRSENKIIIE
jgi:transmembrane sensor